MSQAFFHSPKSLYSGLSDFGHPEAVSRVAVVCLLACVLGTPLAHAHAQAETPATGKRALRNVQGPPTAPLLNGQALTYLSPSADKPRSLRLGQHLLAKTIPDGPVTVLEEAQADLGHVAIVQVGHRAKRLGWVLLLDAKRPKTLWNGDLSASGDPGERIAVALRFERLLPDVRPSVVVGPTSEQLRLCGRSAPALITRKRLTRSGLVAISSPRLGAGRSLTATVTVSKGSGPTPSSPLHLLSPEASSEDAIHGVTPPYALTDGNFTTTWGPIAADAFATLRWAGGKFGIKALTLSFAGPAPRDLRIHTQAGFIDVDVPQDLEPDGALHIAPKHPILGDCLSLQILTHAPSTAGAPDAQTGTQIAELAAHPGFENGSGPGALIAELSGPRRDDAGRLLAHAGQQVLPAVLQAWPALEAQAQRRALPAVLNHVRNPAARALFVKILQTARESASAASFANRSQLIKSLRTTRAVGVQALLIAAINGAPPAEDLLRIAILRKIPDLSNLVLNGLAAAATAREQRLWQAAASTLAARQPEALTAAVSGAMTAESPLPPSIAARLAVTLAHHKLAPGIVLKLAKWARDLPPTNASDPDANFADVWWAISANAAAPSEDASDAFLAQIASEAKPWMQREAALKGLGDKNSPIAYQTAKLALQDPYPRVRSRAVATLATDATAKSSLLKHLAQDRWYTVRQQAVSSLSDSPEFRTRLLKAISDRRFSVRQAAIVRATELGLKRAWPAVENRLAKPGEAVEVKLAGINFAAQQCITEAAQLFSKWALAGLAPAASSSAQELSLASVEALAKLGRGEAIQRRIQQTAEPSFRRVAEQALSTPSTCP